MGHKATTGCPVGKVEKSEFTVFLPFGVFVGGVVVVHLGFLW